MIIIEYCCTIKFNTSTNCVYIHVPIIIMIEIKFYAATMDSIKLNFRSENKNLDILELAVHV